jgi:hypothetical protein
MTINELIQLAKEEGLLYDVCQRLGNTQCITLIEITECTKNHKHTYYKNGRQVYPRRNRVNCHYYTSGSYSTNNCACSAMDNIPNRMVYPKCIGVKCGHYLRKVQSTLFIPK